LAIFVKNSYYHFGRSLSAILDIRQTTVSPVVARGYVYATFDWKLYFAFGTTYL